jgi:hypothetical protein
LESADLTITPESLSKGSILLCPELASPRWTRSGGPYLGAFAHYQPSILTALFLGKKILAPSSLPETIQENKGHPHLHEDPSIENLLELLKLLEQTNNLLYFPALEDINAASQMMDLDVAAGREKGIIDDIGYGWRVNFPGSRDYIYLNSSHGMTEQKQGCIANFILRAYQRFGCEFIEPVYNAEFSMKRFLLFKKILWEVQPEPVPDNLKNTEEVLRFYIPYAPFIDPFDNNKVDFSLIERILRIRSKYADVLEEYQDHIAKMKEAAIIGQKNKKNDGNLIQLNQVFKNELQRGFITGFFRDLALTLISIPIPIPILSLLATFLSTAISKGLDYKGVKDAQERIDFYFYVQSLATIME